MKIASVAAIKAQFSAFLKESEEGPVVVTRNGKPVAVLLAVRSDDELERLVLAHSARFQKILETARQQIRAGEGIGHEEFWQEVAEAKPGKAQKRNRKQKA